MELEASRSLHRIPFPEMSVSTLNGMTVLVCPEMVCASRKLRRRVTRHMQEFNGWPMGPNNKLKDSYAAHFEELTSLKFIDCTQDINNGCAKDVFGKLPLMSSDVWRLLQDWSTFHIHQVKLQEKEKTLCNWNKPFGRTQTPTKDWNTVSEFEEKMFGNMDSQTFISLVQGKNDLGLDDLHRIMENWFRLYNGREVKKDVNGNEVAVEACFQYKNNFRAESNHHALSVGFYGAGTRRVPHNAKGWTWWGRDRPGNNNHLVSRRR